jgi:N-acetyl-anhydromuramyl-L-alanine amidase AmpD
MLTILDPKLQFKSLTYNNVVKNIVLHHAEASVCSIYDIHTWHLEKGWSGCGYHYFVRKDGSIYRGRPESAQGSHCPGQNITSIGICAEGNYMSEEMPLIQKLRIMELIKDIKSRYNIEKIVGHGEVYATSCPGTKYPLSEIKKGEISMKDYKQILTESGLSNPEKWIQIITDLESGKINLEDINYLKFFKTLIEKIGNK